MTKDKEPKERQYSDAERAWFQEQYLDSVWEDWCITGDIKHLANYVRHGGDISSQADRDTIAMLLEQKKLKNPGGARYQMHYDFYSDVEALMKYGEWGTFIDREHEANEAAGLPRDGKKRLIKKTEAIRLTAKKHKIEAAAGRKRYEAAVKLRSKSNIVEN